MKAAALLLCAALDVHAAAPVRVQAVPASLGVGFGAQAGAGLAGPATTVPMSAAPAWNPASPSALTPVPAVRAQAAAPVAAVAAVPAAAAAPAAIQTALPAAAVLRTAAALPEHSAPLQEPSKPGIAAAASKPHPQTAARLLSTLGAMPEPSALNAAFDGWHIKETAPIQPSEGSALAGPLRLSRAPRDVGPDGKETPPPSGLRSLIRVSYLGILHDTAFKTFFSAWAAAAFAPAQAGLYVSLATALFTAPFLLLSAWSGRLADRSDKVLLLKRLKAAELGLAAAGAAALWFASPWAALAVIALLGTRGAVMSPAKYSLLAERAGPDKLDAVNGWLELSTFLALVAGTALGGGLAAWTAGAPALAALAFGATAVLGWFAGKPLFATDLPGSPAPAPAPGPAPRLPRNLLYAASAIALFWFLSSVVQMNIFLFGASALGVGTAAVTGLLTAVGLSTGVGAWAAGQLAKKRPGLWIVPGGAAGVALFLADLGLFGGASFIRSLIDLSLMSASAGLFYVPLNAYFQRESPPAARGRFLGLSNLLTFAAILASAGAYWVMTAALALSPASVFVVLAGISAAGAALAALILRR